MSGIDAKELFPDARERVAGDVEREDARWTDLAQAPEPHQGAGQQKVPDQLVQERRLEGRVLLVTDRSVRGIDLEPPGQRRRPAEQLLVEVVADPSGRLADEQRG